MQMSLILHIMHVPFWRKIYKAPLHQYIWNHIRVMSSLHIGRKTQLSSVNRASGCAGWTASSSTGLGQLRSLFTNFSYLLSSLPHFLCLSSARAFGCRVCLQLTCTAPHNGLYLHSQQSNARSPTNPSVCTILKWTWEHAEAETWGLFHTVCSVAAEERLTALQTTSRGA